MTAAKRKHTYSFRFKLFILLFIILIVTLLVKGIYEVNATKHVGPDYLATVEMPDWVDTQLIDVDGASRRGVKLETLNGIVVHYVGNPGTTAQQNRDYFNSSQSTVSSHFVIGLDGEIIQCVPLDERSSASNDRNIDTISIEVCHPDETGKFTDASYASLVKLTAWLCETGHLKADDIIRHYDVTGKNCPLYFVEHEDAWEQFKSDVEAAMD